MRRDALRNFVLVLLAPALASCGSPAAPSAPAPSIDLTGTWSGQASDSTGPGDMTWRITQSSGASFSGGMTMTDASTEVHGNGSVTGSVSGSAFHFSINVSPGGFEDPYAACSASVSGDGEISARSISGTYAGSNSCTGEITAGQLSLTKSG